MLPVWDPALVSRYDQLCKDTFHKVDRKKTDLSCDTIYVIENIDQRNVYFDYYHVSEWTHST